MFWEGMAFGVVIGSAAGLLLMGMATAAKTSDLLTENDRLKVVIRKAGIEWQE